MLVGGTLWDVARIHPAMLIRYPTVTLCRPTKKDLNKNAEFVDRLGKADISRSRAPEHRAASQTPDDVDSRRVGGKVKIRESERRANMRVRRASRQAGKQ